MIGQMLGHYRVIDKLGAGGMGEVYRAHDEVLHRDVAIKTLPAAVIGDAAAQARLLQEARAAASLNHPHICTIHEVGEAAGQVYIAMELIAGQPLDRIIPARGLPVDRVMAYGLQIADAVAHAHDRGIVHRDLKTANILVTPQGRVKVLDFGLAKRATGGELPDAATATRSLTEIGALAGTLPYMSPEQLRGEPATARSDVWALGVTFHELAAGARPFQGQTALELSSNILHEPPAALPANVPLGLRAVIERCLEKTPEQRYQRAGEVYAALEAIQTGTTPAREEHGRRDRRLRALGRPWLVAAGVVVVAALGVAWWAIQRPAVTRIDSLVVLPFDNVSGDSAQEYFVDGMSEAIRVDLAKITGLKVISRTSAMHYKGTDKRLRDIVQEFGVGAAVEGSVMRVGDRVRITARLIEGATDTQLWADSFERQVEDVLFLQRDLARAIASGIQLSLTPEKEERLSRNVRIDSEAYDAYLLGRHYLNQRTVEGLRRSVAHFEHAIEQDPNFAQGYAGLADAYVLTEIYGALPPAQFHPKAKALALQALKIDPSLGEAYTTLAWIAFTFDFDWARAATEFERALQLNPGYATAHHWYGIYLSAMGRFDRAKAAMARAVEVDPLSPTIVTQAGFPFFCSGELDKAMEIYRKAIASFPGLRMPHTHLARGLVVTGAYEDAIAEIALAEPALINEGLLGMTYGFLGRTADAQRVLQELAAKSRHSYVPAREYVFVYIGLRNNEQALDWLERAYEERGIFTAWLKTWPLYDPLRDEPRFKALLARMRFPD